MAAKLCANCGAVNAAEHDFCYACGANEFKEIAPGLSARLSAASAIGATSAVWLTPARVALLSIFSGGLYALFWLYITWKQLASETREAHYPVWHALAFIVPIYGLFRLYKHIRVINELAAGAGARTFLSPGGAVVALVGGAAVSNILLPRILPSNAITLVGILIFGSAIAGFVLAGAQRSLNGYWHKTRGETLQKTPLAFWEVILVLLGPLLYLYMVFVLPALGEPIEIEPVVSTSIEMPGGWVEYRGVGRDAIKTGGNEELASFGVFAGGKPIPGGYELAVFVASLPVSEGSELDAGPPYPSPGRGTEVFVSDIIDSEDECAGGPRAA